MPNLSGGASASNGSRLRGTVSKLWCHLPLVSLAGSVSLVGFGFDSLIELTSGAALLWRMSADADEERRERVERTSLRIVGGCFLALAAYLVVDSVKTLLLHEAPERSPVGIAITAAAVVVMPLLARAKRNVARQLGSAAMQADSKQSEFCMWLSAIVLAGLVLNAAFGMWWADPAAALVMVPIIAKEGVEGLRAEGVPLPLSTFRMKMTEWYPTWSRCN